MRIAQPPAEARDQERRRVQAAILLVADGRYPRVVVANLAHADSIARELCATATRSGVELSTVRRAVDASIDIVVGRR